MGAGGTGAGDARLSRDAGRPRQRGEAAAAGQGVPLTFTERPFRAVKGPRSVEGGHINRCRPPAQSEECSAQWPNVRRDKAPLLLPATKAAQSRARGSLPAVTLPRKRLGFQQRRGEPRERGGETRPCAVTGLFLLAASPRVNIQMNGPQGKPAPALGWFSVCLGQVLMAWAFPGRVVCRW